MGHYQEDSRSERGTVMVYEEPCTEELNDLNAQKGDPDDVNE